MVMSFPAPAQKKHQGILEQCGEKIPEFPAQRMTQELGAGKYTWLVVWNMAFMTFHIDWEYVGIIIPTDELIFFRGLETTNQILLVYTY